MDEAKQASGANRPCAIYSYSNARSLRSRGRKRERARAYAASRFGSCGAASGVPRRSPVRYAASGRSLVFLRPVTFPGFEKLAGRGRVAGYAHACERASERADREAFAFPSRASNGAAKNRQAGGGEFEWAFYRSIIDCFDNVPGESRLNDSLRFNEPIALLRPV